jgi:fido (protein-threonine AMPylation protein)
MHGQKTLTKLNCPPFGEVQRSEPKFKEALNGAVALARRDSGKKVPRLGELCAWHRRVFGDFVPRGFSYYAGNIRQKKNKAPCLARDVAVNGVTGSPWQKTKADLQSLLLEVATTLVPLENSWDDTEPEERLRILATTIAYFIGRFIQIHPFLDGNGRISRIFWTAIYARYNVPAPYASIAERPGNPYPTLMAKAMNGEFAPLIATMIVKLSEASPEKPPRPKKRKK